jgi:GxxExxY protein
MGENETGREIVDAAIRVHSVLGPGLLESAYSHCLARELARRGASVRREVGIPIEYEGQAVEIGYRADMIVNENVLVELKAVERLLPVHRSQVISYLRLGGFKLGFLLNFHADHMRDGIARLVNGLGQ